MSSRENPVPGCPGLSKCLEQFVMGEYHDISPAPCQNGFESQNLVKMCG